MTTSYHIASLLEKMTSADKDFRFMAINDLMSELQKDAIKLDEDSERKVVRMLLKLLEDKNGEVQNLAVKCMGPLVNKVKDHHVEVIVDTLCANMISDQEQLRDVSSIGLKTVIDQLPIPSSGTGSSLTTNTCRRVTPKIVADVVSGNSTVDVAIQLEGLDILSELLSKYGQLLANFHQSVQETLIPLLSSPRLAVRKRAITALAHLVNVCSQNQFSAVCDSLIKKLDACQDVSILRAYVNCVGAVSKASGSRFGLYLPRIVPMLTSYCGRFDDDELREGCLQTFESIILKCPKEVTLHLPAILELCSKYLRHDPNYHYDDDDGRSATANGCSDGMEVDDERDDGSVAADDLDADHDEEDADEQQEYSDDDDMSWKVRRASAKCLEVALSTRRELLRHFYVETGPLLISGFKEREENVKADIFRAYVGLLKHTKLAAPSVDVKNEEQRILLESLQNQVPKLVKAISKQLREKSIKTRQNCFTLLVELLKVLPGALADHMIQMMPGVQNSLNDKATNSSNIKIDALAFLAVALATHNPQVFHPHISVLVPLVVQAIDDTFYKVTAEALTVVQQLVRVLRPIDAAPSGAFNGWPRFVEQLYAAVHCKLRATDIDQEVKERAIACTGHLLATFGDYLQKEVPSCLSVLLDRLKNEVTRLTTVRALIVISQSSLRISLQPIFASTAQELSEFLRKNHRALRLATLQLLTLLAQNYKSLMDVSICEKVLQELPALISDADLQIAQMTVYLLVDLLDVQPRIVASNLHAYLPPIIRLVHSPLLQGHSLNAILALFTALLKTGLDRPDFGDLKAALTKQPLPYEVSQHGAVSSTASSTAHHQPSIASQSTLNGRQAHHNTAKCLAALVAACPDQAAQTMTELANNLRENSRVGEQAQLFALLAIGEIGRVCPRALDSYQAEQLIMRGFLLPSEEVKSAASQALGALAVGHLEKYLPFVLREIQAQPKRQYLLLHSLKEIIGSESGAGENNTAGSIFRPHIDEIWEVLLAHAECVEDGVRNVVAECLGKLCLLDPERLVLRLKQHFNEKSALMRCTVVTSLKFTIVDQTQAVDPILKEHMGDFLKSIDDPDINVRRVTLITLNSAAHNKPGIIQDCLPRFLPGVYRETKVRKELIREVEMGPFRHTVDDGLDLRKSAFECMYTLLGTCLERLDVFEFLTHVEDGLKDHYDIKMLTYLMLIRLANLCPTQVLQRLDRLTEPLKQTFMAKVKANAVKQEYEKQDELKRCALRAVITLQSIGESDKSSHLIELLQLIKNSPELFQIYENVQKDNASRIHFDGSSAMEVDY